MLYGHWTNYVLFMRKRHEVLMTPRCGTVPGKRTRFRRCSLTFSNMAGNSYRLRPLGNFPQLKHATSCVVCEGRLTSVKN
jgi:hypothetical protein